MFVATINKDVKNTVYARGAIPGTTDGVRPREGSKNVGVLARVALK